jgi:NAD(P)-dependent dehydrogenase (short-subunit alcohol dehydrogenase family)
MPTVMISGANRGLGLEFVRQYLDEGWQVMALCRNADTALGLRELGGPSRDLQVIGLDVSDFAAVDALAARLQGNGIDVLINNAGVFGPKALAEKDPRQSFGHFDTAVFSSVFTVNALAPLKMAEAFYGHVLAGRHKKVVTITSSAGSIAGADGGIYAYRMSKAAVNMAMANLAREAASDEVIVTVLNPGWVRTDMGGPEAVIEVGDSIRRMRGIIDGLTPEDSGAFIDIDGGRLPW